MKGIERISKVNVRRQFGLQRRRREQLGLVQGGGGAAGGRLGHGARGHATPFYGGARDTPCPGAAAAMPAWPMGLAGLAAGPERAGSGQSSRMVFFFFEFIFNAKTNSRKV
jgi:hypothetical protein